MSILKSINPSDGSTVWSGDATSPSDLLPMATAARGKFLDWSTSGLDYRESLLRKFADILKSHAEEMAITISREIGKPLWESRTEVAAMVGKAEISITAHRDRCREFTGGKAITRFRPHGIVTVIGPYNFPGHLPNGHICPALLAGNVILYKPSELAPVTGELLVRCWHEAGLPEDILQLVQGGPEVARALTALPDIDGIFFTGSARTGKQLMQQFSDTPGKILALEMGGNNPLIIDVSNIENIDAAIKIVINSAFISTGQRCTCARRLLVIDSPKASGFLEKLVIAATGLTIDDPFSDPGPFMGPLASPEFPRQILERQDMLLQRGARPLLQAAAISSGTGFLSPGIVDVSNISELPDEEVFGPLLQVLRVNDLDDAIAAANATRFGLASGILTDKREVYEYVLPRLRAGIVNWNTQLTGASSSAPFGGIKDSGNNRPAAYFAADYCSYPVASIEAPVCE